jgi:hypothetical protein
VPFVVKTVVHTFSNLHPLCALCADIVPSVVKKPIKTYRLNFHR